jgi:hypothetical protein
MLPIFQKKFVQELRDFSASGEHRLPVCVGRNAASPPDKAVNRRRKYHRRPACVWGPTRVV